MNRISLFLFLFTSIHYLRNFLHKGKWIEPAGLKIWADEHSVLKNNLEEKRVHELKSLWNSALCVSIMSSTTHISMIKAVRSSVVKKKLVPFVYPNLPMLVDREFFLLFSICKYTIELDSCGTHFRKCWFCAFFSSICGKEVEATTVCQTRCSGSQRGVREYFHYHQHQRYLDHHLETKCCGTLSQIT